MRPAASSRGWGLLSGRLHVSRGTSGEVQELCGLEGRTIPCNSLDGPPVGPQACRAQGRFPATQPDQSTGVARTESPSSRTSGSSWSGACWWGHPHEFLPRPYWAPCITSCSTPWRRATTPAEQTRCGRRSPRARGGCVAAQCPAPTEVPRRVGRAG